MFIVLVFSLLRCVHVWLSPEEHEKLELLGAKEGCSKSILARRILVDYLRHSNIVKPAEKSNILFKNHELEVSVLNLGSHSKNRERRRRS